MEKTLIVKGSQQNGNNAKQENENQRGFSWKENMMEKAARSRAGMEPDPLTTSSMNDRKTGIHTLKVKISDTLYW